MEMKKKTGKQSQPAYKGIYSMTGFGRGAVKSPYGTVTAEIKTFNHKNLNITCTPFEGFFLLEERLKEVFEKKLVRGKVFVRITRDGGNETGTLRNISINEKVIKDYLGRFKNLQKKLAIPGSLEIRDIIHLPGVMEQTADKREEKLWPVIHEATEKAVDDLMKFRIAEGANLAKDLVKRLVKIEKNIREITKEEQASIDEYRTRLTEKITDATKTKEIDKIKLEEEVAAFARNCDIAEELLRLGNHVEVSLSVLKNPISDVGKKLDFIAQEMHREINTIGAKAGGYSISNLVIDIKSEIEKIREQLSNIE
ncbi:MAG: YicC family protein [Candidatus Omnitrophica bacterium]|nr:YicC family protein [Candidatus Omnitrophota bacterium]